jgi:hypothetical protein
MIRRFKALALKADHFRNGSKASFSPSDEDFRCTPVNGHRQGRSACLKSAMCGRLRVGKRNLHVAGLVGAAMCSAF